MNEKQNLKKQEKKHKEKGQLFKKGKKRRNNRVTLAYGKGNKTKFFKKLSNFDFWWTKTLNLYQSILSPSIAFFRHFSRAINVISLYEITPKQGF